MYLKRFVFASALLGGIDLRFYEAAAAAAAGSGGRHLILSFLEKEGEKARRRERRREREAIRCIYPPCRLWLLEEFLIFFLIFLFFLI